MKNQKRNQYNFYSFAHSLLNKNVEVVTTEGSFTGNLVRVESDTIFLETTNRGQTVVLAIRTAFIVTMFHIVNEHRNPFWIGIPGSHNEPIENESVNNH